MEKPYPFPVERAEVRADNRLEGRDCRVCMLPLPRRRDGELSSACRHCGAITLPPRTAAEETPAVLVSLLEADQGAAVTRILSGHWCAYLLGGGFVRGCVYLIGGEPGAGKSTVSIQFCNAAIEESGMDAVYLPSEEMPSIIRDRALRLQCQHAARIKTPPKKLCDPWDLNILDRLPPVCMTVFDSLSKFVGNDPREALRVCTRLTNYAQRTKTPVLIVDQVNKDEDFAGLMSQQHEVDTLIYLRGDRKKKERMWSTGKDRNGEGFLDRKMFMTKEGMVPAAEPPIPDEIENLDVKAAE